MDKVWFMLTLMLDMLPFIILALWMLKEYLPCKLSVALLKLILPVIIYDSLLCMTYMNGLYGAEMMVALRVSGNCLAWALLCTTFHKFYWQFAYMCLFNLPYMLGILQISAFCINFVDMQKLPEFMAITCFRFLFYCLFAYPFYRLKKKYIISNFEIEDKRVWRAFTISQLILNMAMLLTLRTDYAANGIAMKDFMLQVVMILASTSVTIFLFYGFYYIKDAEITKERQERDAFLIELSAKQYASIQDNINQMYHIRHDLKYHMRTLEQLMKEKKYAQAEKYLEDYNLSIPDSTRIKFCENMSINALLEYYYAAANEKHIEIQFELYGLAECQVDDLDLNIILGNALENAMEASMEVEEGKRFVRACAKKMANQIFITIDNQFDGVVKKNEDSILSKKRSYRTSGYGNASMEAVVARYNGTIKREIQGNNYCVSIVLYDGVPAQANAAGKSDSHAFG